MVAKRNTNSTPGRILAGLDDMERLTRAGDLPTVANSIRKGTMSCKGVVDIKDVVATDAGGAGVCCVLLHEL
jgi:hypothetical protein